MELHINSVTILWKIVIFCVHFKYDNHGWGKRGERQRGGGGGQGTKE